MTEKRLLPVLGRQMGSHIVMSKEDAILVIPDHQTVTKGFN